MRLFNNFPSLFARSLMKFDKNNNKKCLKPGTILSIINKNRFLFSSLPSNETLINNDS